MACQALDAESGRDSNTLQLTLSEAIRTHRLQEFVAQEEARGVPAASLKEFQELASRLIKDTPQANQISRSPGRGGSSGK
jgi:methylmalonyl-CoA mutase N-terminal domain/subunit